MFDSYVNRVIDHYKKMVSNREIVVAKLQTVIQGYKETCDLQSKMIDNLNRQIELQTNQINQSDRVLNQDEIVIQAQKEYIAKLELQIRTLEALVGTMDRISALDKGIARLEIAKRAEV
jgi:uncharacterized protein (DUF3084 family)